jgi:hypothetical protein
MEQGVKAVLFSQTPKDDGGSPVVAGIEPSCPSILLPVLRDAFMPS